MNDDVVDRLLASVNAARATDRSELLREAAAEIKALRKSSVSAMKKTSDLARQVGHYEGTLMGIMHRCPDPEGVARRSLEHFGVRIKK